MGNRGSGSRESRVVQWEKPLSFDSSRMKDIGSRYTPSGSNSEYNRDPDRLYSLYKPLRLSIYKQVSSKLYSQTDKEDLLSYINEHFVRLVKEYDVSGGVDFPGYIKTLLTFRAMRSFMGTLTKVYSKEDSIGIQEELDDKLNEASGEYVDEEDVIAYYDDFIRFVWKQKSLSQEELTVLQGVLIDERNIDIIRDLKREHEMSQNDAVILVDTFRDELLGYLSEFTGDN